LSRDPKEAKHNDLIIIQKYVAKPHLYGLGYKYDFRVYAVLTGVKPLRIYIYKDGIVRLCQSLYDKPTEKNIKNHKIHLANLPAEIPQNDDQEDLTDKLTKSYRDVLDEFTK